jgi:hypothetical protein
MTDPAGSEPPVASADASDDEFAGIEPRRPRKSPVMAAVVIALSAVVSFHLRSDLDFAFSPRVPEELGDARALAGRGGALPDNRLVSVSGVPDRVNQLSIEPRGERTREGLFRLRGAPAPVLFVRAADTARRLDLADRWTGRLRRLSELPYAASLGEYFAKETHATRSLDLVTLKRALAEHSGFRDRTGEPVALPLDTLLSIEAVRSGELVVRLSKEKFPTLEDARHEIVQLGLSPIKEAAPESNGDEDTFGLVLAFSEASRDALAEKLDQHGLTFAAHEQRWATFRLRDLRDEGTVLAFGSEKLAWPDVKAISWDAPITVGPDAWVITEGEAPPAFWWAPVTVALLTAFALFNLWYLLRARRA